MEKQIEITSLPDYLNLIDEHCRGHELFLFRGQSEDKPLLPKFARKDFKVKDRSVETEKKMFKDFIVRGRPHLVIEPQSRFDWLALAQHHGMSTRLLDWTQNPLAALWFAVRNPKSEGFGVIWIFKVLESNLAEIEKDSNPFAIKETKVFQPTHISSRFIAQGGWFTIHKAAITPLEENTIYREQLTKFKIPVSCFSVLRNQLDRNGINSASLFPDLDGLCDHVVWLNAKFSDEN